MEKGWRGLRRAGMGVRRAMEGSRQVMGPEVLDKGWRRASWGREGLDKGSPALDGAENVWRRAGEGLESTQKGWTRVGP